jgi:hypothetical protein
LGARRRCGAAPLSPGVPRQVLWPVPHEALVDDFELAEEASARPRARLP